MGASSGRGVFGWRAVSGGGAFGWGWGSYDISPVPEARPFLRESRDPNHNVHVCHLLEQTEGLKVLDVAQSPPPEQQTQRG